jgi:excisionase family DNA binding protein
MKNLVPIGRAAKMLGVSEVTLRRRDSEGKLPSIKTEGRHRRYDSAKLKPEAVHKFDFADDRKAIACARVSSHGQKPDLECQKQALELFCSKNGWTFEIIAGLGSGVNYRLEKLLSDVLDDNAGRLAATRKDRLLRF